MPQPTEGLRVQATGSERYALSVCLGHYSAVPLGYCAAGGQRQASRGILSYHGTPGIRSNRAAKAETRRYCRDATKMHGLLNKAPRMMLHVSASIAAKSPSHSSTNSHRSQFLPCPLPLRLESFRFHHSSKEPQQLWRLNNVAAFCACCGTEITLKAEACPVCGTPRHGMSQPDLLLTLDESTEPSQDGVELVRDRASGSHLHEE
jgi:hypothetical protein